MLEMQLDLQKLPLGVLKIERVKKSKQILQQKLLKFITQGGTITSVNQQKISQGSTEFYSTLPYDFGKKMPDEINHLKHRYIPWVMKMDLLADIYTQE
jgi:hypothetical protein